MGIRFKHPLCRNVLEDVKLRERRHEELVCCIEGLANMDDCCDSEDDDDDKSNSGDENEMEVKEKSFQDENNDHDDAQDEEDKERDDSDEDEDEEVEYTVDEITRYLAGLRIEERNVKQHSKSNAEIANDSISTEDNNNEDEEEEDDDDDDDDGNEGDDLDMLFNPLDGTAMYYTACKMNHSCDPNIVAGYSYSSSSGSGGGWGSNYPLVLHCLALRDIQKGEELCISYIKSDDTLEQ
eukprot:11906614-Ditylum_brightwellii.AAC.1